jgi:nitroreductase/NAD-dependent dihydropyrimidine dehydrogenase PreA subunit
MAPAVTFHFETCARCGLCVEVCPSRVIRRRPEGLPEPDPERAGICLACGHCMAVCPTRSVTAGALDYDRDFPELARNGLDYPAFAAFLASRRSIRAFKPHPVPREALERIAAAVAFAPMSFPPHKLRLTIFQDRAAVERLLPPMLDFYGRLLEQLRKFMPRRFIRKAAGPELFSTIRNHVEPIMRLRVPAMRRPGAVDEITRGAPALILFHAPVTAEGHTQDGDIALTYGMLAAHALGLGACCITLVPPAVNRTPGLREQVRLPAENEVVAALAVGYPWVKYQRGIRRELAGVEWL